MIAVLVIERLTTSGYGAVRLAVYSGTVAGFVPMLKAALILGFLEIVHGGLQSLFQRLQSLFWLHQLARGCGLLALRFGFC